MIAASAVGARRGATTTLRISEIFYSLQGEAASSGYPTTFVRLTGCPLRCQYCDTSYAFSGGAMMTLSAIRGQVETNGARHVCITGGEPLAQPGVLDLMTVLCDDGFEVSLETSGALDVAPVDARVSRVVDLKTPGSLEVHRNRLENLAVLGRHDQIKFVVCDRDDYEWARLQCASYDLPDRVGAVWFSPSADQLDATELAGWILADGLRVRLQIQLHKLLWGTEPGR